MNKSNEDSKYENVIKNFTDEQLICEASIINKQYKIVYAQKKAIEDEFDRRLNLKCQGGK